MAYNKKKSWVRNKLREKRQPQDGANGRSGYVYVVHLGIENLYKIGRTGNMEQRLRSLAAANPRIVATVACRVKDMYRSEGVLHRRYRRQRMNGREVYRLEPGDLENIQSYLDHRSPAVVTTI